MSRPVVAQLAPDRRASKPSRQRPRRWITVAGALLAVTYGGLFMASSVMVPERVQVADLSDIQASFRPVRGADQSDDYAEAAALLSEAHHSTLGLFPRYDDAGLNAAADAFGEIARESPDDQYGQEAALALGRIRLLQNQADASRTALESVVARGSYRAPEAVRLLDYLDTQAASE